MIFLVSPGIRVSEEPSPAMLVSLAQLKLPYFPEAGVNLLIFNRFTIYYSLLPIVV
jgi:hypothetical protein